MSTPRIAIPQSVPFGQTCIVLDVRTGVEHAGVALKQEHHHIPLDEFDAKKFLRDNRIDPARPVYTLCRSGKRATQAAEALIAAGHDNVQVVEGGITACEAAGIPVRKGTVMSLERQVRIAAGLLVILGVALGASVSPWFYALAGFVGGGLVFAGVTDYCGMALVLAKAPWNKCLSAAPAACSSAAPACTVGNNNQASPAVAVEGIAFYSPANGKPAHVQNHAAGKSGGAGGCS